MKMMMTWVLSAFLCAATAGIVTANTHTTISQPRSLSGRDFLTVKKCCKEGKAVKIDPKSNKYTCSSCPKPFDMEIYATNETNLWLLANISELNVRYQLGLPCKSFFYLDPRENETFRLLHNGSLFTPDDYRMENNFCVDNVMDGDGEIITTAILCTDIASTDLAANVKYTFTFLFVSMIALVLIAGYIVWYRNDIHTHTKYYVLGYVCTLATVTLIMALFQVLEIYLNNTVVVFAGILIYYLILTYHVWLNMAVMNFYKNWLNKNVYNRWYFAIPFSVPIVFVCAGLATGLKSILPNVYMLPIAYENNLGWTIILFFVPIFCSLLYNTLTLVSIDNQSIQSLINDFSSTTWKDIDNRKRIKKLKRIFQFIVILMWFVYFCDIIVFLLPKTSGHSIQFVVYDVLRTLMGFFIALVFVRRRHYRCSREQPVQTELQTLNRTANGSILSEQLNGSTNT